MNPINNIAFLFFLITLCNTCRVCVAQEKLFNEEKSEHFIILYRCDKDFVDYVCRHAEKYYTHIENDLGLKRYDNFWSWENRCKIILFSSEQEYQSATNQAQWAGGHVDYKNRIIYSYPWAQGFVTSLLPHEMTHIIFREYVKDNPHIPLWIDEGIAQYEEKYAVPDTQHIIKQAVSERKICSIEELDKIQSADELNNTDDVTLFYLQSYSIIYYLIHEYGQTRFRNFLQQLKAGKDITEALRFAYSGSIDSEKTLNTKWRNWIMAQ